MFYGEDVSQEEADAAAQAIFTELCPEAELSFLPRRTAGVLLYHQHRVKQTGKETALSRDPSPVFYQIFT